MASVGVLLLVVLTFYLASTINANNIQQIYVKFDPQDVSYSLTRKDPETWVACGEFRNAMNKTGWTFLDITTDRSYKNPAQAYAAGLVEGYLTKTEIDQTWHNNGRQDFCPLPLSPDCQKLYAFLKENLAWMKKQVMAYPESEYWQQVGLFLIQVRGLTDGYLGKPRQPSMDIEVNGLWLLQISEDIPDICRHLGIPIQTTWSRSQHPLGSGSCSALIKGSKCYILHQQPATCCGSLLRYYSQTKNNECTWETTKDIGCTWVLPGGKDVYVSQVTWNVYTSMLRTLKKYTFNYATNQGLIPGREMTFSSYPGMLYSMDDFYVLSSSHMVILETSIRNYCTNDDIQPTSVPNRIQVSQETTIGNSNVALWKHITTASVLQGLRVVASNRLAHSGSEWVKTFSQYNSGTYNNEWMVVDYKKFFPNSAQPIQPGFFTLLDQVPGDIKYADMSQHLIDYSYYASYNVPYFPSIYNVSGWPEQAAKYGDFFTYDGAARGQIFRRDHHKVKDMTSMLRMMRYNDYKHDPLAKCKCNPPYSAENAIASRCELNPVNGTYILPVFGHRMHGATDVKITSNSLSKNHQFIAQAGPTNDQQPTFQWSKLNPDDRAQPHQGMPDIFDFKPVLVKWPLV